MSKVYFAQLLQKVQDELWGGVFLHQMNRAGGRVRLATFDSLPLAFGPYHDWFRCIRAAIFNDRIRRIRVHARGVDKPVDWELHFQRRYTDAEIQ